MKAAGEAATQGAQATATMQARAGRASYVSADKVINAPKGQCPSKKYICLPGAKQKRGVHFLTIKHAKMATYILYDFLPNNFNDNQLDYIFAGD